MLPIVLRSPSSPDAEPRIDVQSPESRQTLASGLSVRKAIVWIVSHCPWLPSANAKEIARKLVVRALRRGHSLETA